MMYMYKLKLSNIICFNVENEQKSQDGNLLISFYKDFRAFINSNRNPAMIQADQCFCFFTYIKYLFNSKNLNFELFVVGSNGS